MFLWLDCSAKHSAAQGSSGERRGAQRSPGECRGAQRGAGERAAERSEVQLSAAHRSTSQRIAAQRDASIDSLCLTFRRQGSAGEHSAVRGRAAESSGAQWSAVERN